MLCQTCGTKKKTPAQTRKIITAMLKKKRPNPRGVFFLPVRFRVAVLRRRFRFGGMASMFVSLILYVLFVQNTSCA